MINFIKNLFKKKSTKQNEVDAWDDQRDAMYSAWKKGKNWVNIEVHQNDSGKWIATCNDPQLNKPLEVERDTKAQVIYSIVGTLSGQGFEIENLAEVQGIV